MSRSPIDLLAIGIDTDVARRDEPLDAHCTWRIGGPADLLVEPSSLEQLSSALRAAADHGVPVVVIGDGSNLLFADAGVRGVVIKIGRAMSSFTIDGTRVMAEAGVSVPDLARALAGAGLAGLEHAANIPGALGGLIFMNGGSYGGTVGDIVRRVQVMDRAGQLRWMDRDECGFGYRRSVFQTNDLIVVGAEIECVRGDKTALEDHAADDLRERERKFPLDAPNCGSVFQSTGAMYDRHGPPGKVIEDTGLKGLRIGGARVSDKHANFIENLGDATSADVMELIRRIRLAVHERTGLWINCEVRYVSSNGAIRPAHECLEAVGE